MSTYEAEKVCSKQDRPVLFDVTDYAVPRNTNLCKAKRCLSCKAYILLLHDCRIRKLYVPLLQPYLLAAKTPAFEINRFTKKFAHNDSLDKTLLFGNQIDSSNFKR